MSASVMLLDSAEAHLGSFGLQLEVSDLAVGQCAVAAKKQGCTRQRSWVKGEVAAGRQADNHRLPALWVSYTVAVIIEGGDRGRQTVALAQS